MKRLLALFSTALLSFFLFGTALTAYAQSPQPVVSIQAACANAAIGFAHCDALQLKKTIAGITPFASAPGGLNPVNLQAAYKLPSSTAGSGQTVAIVDAMNDPNAESDLATYRAQFGLSPCTTANGCFKKVNETGGTTFPASDVGWSEEISLDLDMVSAIAPNSHILLVEASTASFADLATAVNEAAALGANAISNSYGGGEASGETSIASAYSHPGIAITASSGDGGFGVEVPAAFNTVVAAGGTSLRTASNARGWTETAWNGAGSGCSAFISKPSVQKDTGCARRTVADVSAVADPNTGVSVFDTFGGVGGWLIFGGTSVSSPIIASVFALAGNTSSINPLSTLYGNTASLFDVTSGSNGSCGGSYLCTAKAGYDGPTGLGTPNGVGAF